MTFFDDTDVFYCANSLTIVQLRHEIKQAELKTSVADTFRDTEYQTEVDLFPWADYATTGREAIEWQRQSKPKQTNPHPMHIDVEAIKAKTDIVAVIEGYTQLRKASKNFSGKCPIHQDKHPSMTVYPDNQSWRCYGCNRGGDVIAFIMAVENTDFRGATAILG